MGAAIGKAIRVAAYLCEEHGGDWVMRPRTYSVPFVKRTHENRCGNSKMSEDHRVSMVPGDSDHTPSMHPLDAAGASKLRPIQTGDMNENVNASTNQLRYVSAVSILVVPRSDPTIESSRKSILNAPVSQREKQKRKRSY